MYKNKKISIVIPCYNEEKQIVKVVQSLPDFVDNIVVIDDKSTDGTEKVIKNLSLTEPRLISICHPYNQGVGAAIASGYKWSRDHLMDIAVVMAGDGQMDPAELPRLLDPIVAGEFDYTKGNRLKYPGAYHLIPKKRFFGNQILSFLTKIASGYWKISDAQNGYAAINLNALNKINLDEIYKRYGQPNDMLVKLNIQNLKVCDVIMKPVYGVGEESKMNIKKLLFTLPVLLSKLFCKRVFLKYIVKDFNLIAPLYFFGIFNALLAGIFFLRTSKLYFSGITPELSLVTTLYTFQLSVFLILTAMYFDMKESENLQ